MLETVLFYIISLALIVFALGVVAARSAIYSVLFLVAAMCMMAGLFILLKAFLVATILVLVYAGAILVLFLFVVMLIDTKKIEKSTGGAIPATPASADRHRSPLRMIIAVAISGIVFLQIRQVIRSIPAEHVPAVQGTTHAIGHLLFNNYLLPFELTSFLLLTAVVGVVVLAKKGDL